MRHFFMITVTAISQLKHLLSKTPGPENFTIFVSLKLTNFNLFNNSKIFFISNIFVNF